MLLNPVISKLSSKLVVLASASPRRLEILTNAGLRFEVVPSWFKETLDKSLFKAPYEYAVETAKQKALEVAQRMPLKHLKTPDIVIGADTVVTVDGLILEKPTDKQDAYRMLSRLSGKEHSVFTGVAIMICQEKNGSNTEYKVVDFYEETKVKFSDLSEEMLWEYINSGEPMDKAGGYGIQALGGMLVEYVQGDFLNVVGFPLNHFCKQLGLLFNSPPESPAHKIKREDLSASDGSWTVFNSLSKCVANGEVELQETSNGRDASQTSMREQNVMGTECSTCDRQDVPHSIMNLIDGFKASKTLFTAAKLKVFDLLNSSNGLTLEEVASQINASVFGTERLLDAAVSLGLLEKVKQQDVYRNTEEARRFLVSDSPLSLHGYILHCNDMVWPLFSHLESAVREGTSQHERAFGKMNKDMFQDVYYSQDDIKMRFMKAMHSIVKVTGKDVAMAFDLSSFKTACDIGGCTGAMAYELTEVHPGLLVTVFDLPRVIEMRRHFQSRAHTDRVTFVAGDFFKDDLPQADLYILARILHDWSDEKVHVLLNKVSQVCTPGCGLLVSEILLDEERRRPSRALFQALSMTEGKQRSAGEYSDLLEKHGFATQDIKYTNNLLDAMLFIKEDSNDKRTLLAGSSASIETAELV
ncbi:probable bifunctional dTTP/UTP pyrophosphatase/methyltransferase protein isoform X2 [Triplophysa rosa]|uniref:N-acetylserotonin O-methyltransferase-like protein n=1 Tax=Triplophysa rosa TaxID=992332 RepID=A0A9W7WUL0_TRIRA|nr:probable bifunctional dTTP/UTP pyrophosphatase/methyltransferase protein isoform X2 [Triplophysa rosa]KAI7808611.1 N-acetylserotonin O-methyltransferase-like protein [Triplophysa rosa]